MSCRLPFNPQAAAIRRLSFCYLTHKVAALCFQLEMALPGVSPVGWVFDTVGEVLREAKRSTKGLLATCFIRQVLGMLARNSILSTLSKNIRGQCRGIGILRCSSQAGCWARHAQEEFFRFLERWSLAHYAPKTVAFHFEFGSEIIENSRYEMHWSHHSKTWKGISLAKNRVHWQTLATSKSREKPMNPQELFCPDMACPARGQVGKGNIHVHSLKDKRCICDVCRKTFATTTGTIFHRLRSDPQLVMWVIVLLAYGCPIQAIVKAFHLDERTVCDWQKRAGAHCQQVHEHLLENSQHD